MKVDRFDYFANLRTAETHRWRSSAVRPCARRHATASGNYSKATVAITNEVLRSFGALVSRSEIEWQKSRAHVWRPIANDASDLRAPRKAKRQVQHQKDLKALEEVVPSVAKITVATKCERDGNVDRDIDIVAGSMSTWYGTGCVRYPTVFACYRDNEHQNYVENALKHRADIVPYLQDLHRNLVLGEEPAVQAMHLLYMVRQGNSRAYGRACLLPEMADIKYPAFNRNYYFANAHAALLNQWSTALAVQFLCLDTNCNPSFARCDEMRTLWVCARDMGGAIRRPATDFGNLQCADRWASVVLQEVASSVFGTLIFAEVWGYCFGFSPSSVIAYYLSECLRYIARGLGCFPDSDGMFLQMSYFVQIGVLSLDSRGEPRLVGETDVVVAGLRSLARVLADALLGGKVGEAVALYRTFGPEKHHHLRPLLDRLRDSASESIEYEPERLYAHAIDC